MVSFRGGGKSNWKLTSHRIGVFMILSSFLWGLYLIKVQLDARRNHSQYLKEQIIELSKRYVHALAKEKNFNTIDGQQSGKSHDSDFRYLFHKNFICKPSLICVKEYSLHSYKRLDQYCIYIYLTFRHLYCKLLICFLFL